MKTPREAPSERARIRRLPKGAAYDRATIDAILDAGFVGYVAFVADGAPALVPMTYARIDDELILHGSVASRAMRTLGAGAECCFCVTHVDGLVLARSAFHHSVNYRSVVVHGRGRAVLAESAKRAALQTLVERIMPGRSAEARPPNGKELAATAVVALPLGEAAAKLRVGGPQDDDADLGLPVWAGVIPLALRASTPVAADDLGPGIERPDSVDAWVGRHR